MTPPVWPRPHCRPARADRRGPEAASGVTAARWSGPVSTWTSPAAIPARKMVTMPPTRASHGEQEGRAYLIRRFAAPDGGSSVRDLSATRKLQLLDLVSACVASIIPVSCKRAPGAEAVRSETQPRATCSPYPQAVRWIEGAPMPARTNQTRSTNGALGRRRVAAAALVMTASLAAWGVTAWARPAAAPLGATPPLGASSALVDARQRLDPPASPRLEATQPESPAPLDRDVTPRGCAACRLADETTGRIPLETLHVQTRALQDGMVVRATVLDPETRELLWKAMVARGELIESLRGGHGRDLCNACAQRSEMLAALQIAVRRIPDGVEIYYTSTHPEVVRQIHDAARATRPFVSSF